MILNCKIKSGRKIQLFALRIGKALEDLKSSHQDPEM